ncbi:MAG: trypsin-like peptidase domain-containing protein [Chloroflexota bacterium]|nr:trypsin-like peptidase domain-containing protein [Chloroflexota bacterium]
MTERPDVDNSEQPTSSYTPPSEARPSWPTSSSWTQRTPEHWLEPIPGQPRPERHAAQRGTGRTMAAVFVVALVASLVGSGATYLALDATGRLDTQAIPAALASPSPQPAATPNSRSTPAPATPVDASLVTRAAEAVSPAIVTITTRAGEATDPFSLPATGVGSGIIFDSAGWVLTNRHVVAGASQVTVQLQDGREVTGTVYGEDTLTDLAIVEIDADDLPVATIGDSSTLRPGDLAIAIGSPLGQFTNSVTSGVISALGRSVPVSDPETGQGRGLRNLIQTDAAINFGNSGGALVDAAGTVVGVYTAVASDAQGIGFAIPINIARPIMRQAVEGQPLARPWMGIVYVPIDRNIAEQHDLPVDYGALITSDDPRQPAITPGSPAEEAGLQDGDILTSINDMRIDATHNLDDVLSEYQPGDRLTMMILRDGTTQQVSLTLGTRPADLQ